MAKKLRFFFLGPLGLLVGYLLLLAFPYPLFAYQFTQGNITLYCDEPIPALSAAKVLDDVQRRLEKCPLYTGHPHQNAFICDQRWRYVLLASKASNGGGVSLGFCPWNVFLRKSNFNLNVLYRPNGQPAGKDRPLAYYMAHEITHNLTTRYLGLCAAMRLPAWKNEGYADYVGKGGDFDFEKNLALFQKDDPSLDPSQSGLYLRYHLLVAELLDHRKMTVGEMLTDPTDRQKLEEDLLQEGEPNHAF